MGRFDWTAKGDNLKTVVPTQAGSLPKSSRWWFGGLGPRSPGVTVSNSTWPLGESAGSPVSLSLTGAGSHSGKLCVNLTSVRKPSQVWPWKSLCFWFWRLTTRNPVSSCVSLGRLSYWKFFTWAGLFLKPARSTLNRRCPLEFPGWSSS